MTGRLTQPVNAGRPSRRARRRGRSAVAWGFADQGISSATNFGLTLVAGRILGASGLGTVFLGFSAYLIALGLQRRLLTDPLQASSAAADVRQRRDAVSHSLTVALTASGLGAVGLALAGVIVPGFAGRGLLLVAPWIVPALAQDLVRNVLFLDRRGLAATVNDGAWLAVMGATVPLAWMIGRDWAVMACWGLGATAGALLGLAQLRSKPGRPVNAWRWWRRDAWPFGKWNAGAAVAANVGGNVGAFIVSGIIGAQALGGLRAAQSVFAPLTLITPAIALPGLPAVARAAAVDPRRGRRVAVGLSALALGAAAAFVLALALGAWRLLPFLFGHEFGRYRELIWPIATGQLFVAAGVGLALLLKARQLGRLLLVNRAVAAIVGVVLVAILASMYGLLGAAWGGAVGHIASTLVLAYSTVRFGVKPITSPTGAARGRRVEAQP